MYNFFTDGGVAEWLKAHAWKACLPKGNAGSNPAPSAMAQNYRDFVASDLPQKGRSPFCKSRTSKIRIQPKKKRVIYFF